MSTRTTQRGTLLLRVGFSSCVAVLCSLNVAGAREAVHWPAAVFVFDLHGDGRALTSPESGVDFDMMGVGRTVRMGWTSAGSDDSFLVMDRNGDGRITDGSEIASSEFRDQRGTRVTEAVQALVLMQGFSLHVLEGPLSPGIEKITAEDRTYSQLRLWTDVNHDGRSEPAELRSLSDSAIASISLAFQKYPNPVVDSGRNRSLLEGSFTVSSSGARIQRRFGLVELASRP